LLRDGRRQWNAIFDQGDARPGGSPTLNSHLHLFAAGDKRKRKASRQGGRASHCSGWDALLVKCGDYFHAWAQGANCNGVEPRAEIVRVDHLATRACQRLPDSSERGERHPRRVDPAKRNLRALEGVAHRAIGAERNHARCDPILATSHAELDHQLLQPTQPEPVDQVRN